MREVSEMGYDMEYENWLEAQDAEGKLSVAEVKALYGTEADVCSCGAAVGADGVYLCSHGEVK